VFVFEHTPKQLFRFTEENSTILWEPGRGTSGVYFPDVKARIIATVSPDENLFREFKMDAKMFYMPPPSELQLRLMGQIYRRIATGLHNCPTDEEIRERVKRFGPSIRMVLCWSSYELADFERLDKTKLVSLLLTTRVYRLHWILQYILWNLQDASLVYLIVWLNMWFIETVLIASLDMPAVIIYSAVKKSLMR